MEVFSNSNKLHLAYATQLTLSTRNIIGGFGIFTAFVDDKNIDFSFIL